MCGQVLTKNTNAEYMSNKSRSHAFVVHKYFSAMQMAASVLTSLTLGRQHSFFNAGGVGPAKFKFPDRSIRQTYEDQD